MAIGEGKYDIVVEMVRQMTNAQACAVLILGGSRGSGFSVHVPPGDAAQIPEVLRDMANQIEANLRGLS